MKKKLIASVLALATCFAFGGALAGCSGKDGATGATGAAGAAGKSAYEIWLDAGNTGSEADFLESLKGSGSAVCDHKNMMKAELINVAGLMQEEAPIHTATPVKNDDGEVIDWEFTPGKVLNVCVDCGYSKITEEVLHVIDSYTKPATCTTEGSKETGCLVCDYYSEKEVLPLVDHNIDTSNPENGVAVVSGTINACVDEAGYVAFKCAACDYTEVTNEYDRYHYVTEWKLSANGLSVVGTCSRFCKAKVEIDLPTTYDDINYAYTPASCTDAKPMESFDIYVNTKVNTVKADYENLATEAKEGFVKVEVKKQAADPTHFYGSNAMPTSQRYVMNTEESYKGIVTELKGFESTCKTEGQGFFMCELCSAAIPVTTYQEHTVASYTKDDAEKAACQTTSSGTCSVCNEKVTKDPAEHTYDYTLVEADKKVLSACTACNLPGETYEYEVILDSQESTCNVKGYLKVVLKDGNNTVKTLERAYAGHTAMVNGEKVLMTDTVDMAAFAGIVTEMKGLEANCATDTNNVGYGVGSGFYMCADCNGAIPVTTTRAHVAKEGTNFDPATCTKVGHVDCKNCNQTITIPALAPEYEYTLVAVNPEYTVFALYASCKNCKPVELTDGDAEPEEVLHHYCVAEDLVLYNAETEEGDVYKEATNSKVCEAYIYVYNYVKDGKVIASCNGVEKVAHKYNEFVMNAEDNTYDLTKYSFITELNGKNATCKDAGTDGEGFFMCTECKGAIPVITTREHNVNYNAVAADKKQAATCTADGYVTGTCDFCKDEVTKVLEATGHTLVVDSANATTVTFRCAVCYKADAADNYSLTLAWVEANAQVKEFVSEATCYAAGITYYEYLFEDVTITIAVTTANGTSDKTFELGDILAKFEIEAPQLTHSTATPANPVVWTTTYTAEVAGTGEDAGKTFIATYVVTHKGYYCEDGCGKLIETYKSEGVEDESLRVEKPAEEESEEEVA